MKNAQSEKIALGNFTVLIKLIRNIYKLYKRGNLKCVYLNLVLLKATLKNIF